eukprot:3258387-Prymnesium_polylepis.1
MAARARWSSAGPRFDRPPDTYFPRWYGGLIRITEARLHESKLLVGGSRRRAWSLVKRYAVDRWALYSRRT